MATLALSVAGQFVGGVVGGPIGATVGRALGALAGSAVDGWLFGGGKKAEAPLFDVRLGSSAEGLGVPRLYGWGRLAGNIIWARELVRHVSDTAGSKGFGGPEPEQPEEVLASFAVGFCEGRVARLGRIWADGQLLDTRGLNLRFYHGDEDQLPDSLIEAIQGVGNAPAYRGLCYLVVENLPLSRFGNRIPQLSAELCRVVGDLEPSIRAVTIIPGATEFGYDPVPRVRVLGPGYGVSENAHQGAGQSDWSCSMDELQALCPNLEHVALVVSWFGDDLRCGQCSLGPRVEGTTRTVEGTIWSVAGIGRGTATVVSSHSGGPAYGGTPSDSAVLAAIADLKARGLKVTLYPFVLMDVPQDNDLSDPYGGAEQAVYPWRGRLTCHPAPGQPGSPDGTVAAAAQVADFVPGYRTMMLHYANLAVTAGGVDALLIGSEMVGLTKVRGASNSFPFVAALVELAADMRAVVGPTTKLTYAADWSEYSGCRVGGGKYFHLDPLWASDDIDAVGIDNYMPLADWRDGEAHADLALSRNGYDLDYLADNIEAGEGFDWYYASDADRRAQIRTPITDGAHGEPWVWRVKDIASFWSEQHFDRPDGVRSSTPTAWVPGSKPVWLTEVGCGAVNKGANQPNIFGDEKSAEDGRPYFSSGTPDGLIQRQVLRAHVKHWTNPAKNPSGMVDPERLYCWTWDARPFPAFPALTAVWADGANHRTGHWLTGRLGAMASDELASALAGEHGCSVFAASAAPLIGGLTVSGPGSARDVIEPILEMTGQRLAARNGALVGVVQGPGVALTLEPDFLAEVDAPVLSRRRGDAAEKPGRLSLGHFDRERDYLAATSMALRPGNGPLVSENLPLVLDGPSARLAAERLLDLRAASGDRVEFALPPNAIALEPGDRIALPDVAEGPFEISEIRDGSVRRVTAGAVVRGDAVATGVDRPRGSAGVPVPPVVPLSIIAHLPPLPTDPGRSRLVVGAYADPWPGLVRVSDEASGSILASLVRPAVFGDVLTAFAPGPLSRWDRGAGLEINLGAGHLADVDTLSALAGSNRIAVQTDAGDWEVIGFAQAELIGPGQYRLTQLLRGLEGSDAAMGSVSAGRRVVVLDARVAILPIDTHWIGESRSLRFSAGQASGLMETVSLGLGPALPLAPVHLQAMRQADGAIALHWTRRSRTDADGWGVAEPMLEHVPESWRVEIFDAGIVRRTIETAVPVASYGLADQTADFGGPAPVFDFTVRQISLVLGAGHAAMGALDE
ncbi:glycoside hydrolase/phage tail family protein [Devosia sp. XJ19-1]|uniref:Glycoside hydrolase/phage tail family protein n=1 Tax=Devosia ureilytica TaxID=2952754 RepID=A0A9Q4AQJ3_9HYPH|nr:glycoside hydrolase/phage tail family protein [Devosia ureilytica]MCP8884244.1 glycoside hydrolase/phage tail family protein [Devosia ureilytica]MCP8887852.1 glycoside hydrolase/phage tail family protein [Devosia ureilytica]